MLCSQGLATCWGRQTRITHERNEIGAAFVTRLYVGSQKKEQLILPRGREIILSSSFSTLNYLLNSEAGSVPYKSDEEQERMQLQVLSVPK